LAIELLCACQGIDLLAPMKTGVIGRRIYGLVRGVSQKVEEDRSLAGDIGRVAGLISEGAFAGVLA